MKGSNYCSFEISQRLVEVGIEIETENYWCHWDDGEWTLGNGVMETPREFIPAPAFAEIWAELIKHADNNEKNIVHWIQGMDNWNSIGTDIAILVVEVCSNVTKLAELLIWVKEKYVR